MYNYFLDGRWYWCLSGLISGGLRCAQFGTRGPSYVLMGTGRDLGASESCHHVPHAAPFDAALWESVGVFSFLGIGGVWAGSYCDWFITE